MDRVDRWIFDPSSATSLLLGINVSVDHLSGTLNLAYRALDSCVSGRTVTLPSSQLLHIIRSPAVPVSVQTSDDHMIGHAALGPGFAQTGAAQLAVPQPPTPPTAAPAAFEVSTVRLNRSGSGNSDSDFNNGLFTATNIQLKSLMEYSAYGIPQPRILGGPKWLDSERFDIEAKMESAAAERLRALSRGQRRAQTQAMFQQLLADRFKLAVHWEMRELPVYALVATKNGPLLQESMNAPGEAGASSSDGQFSAKGMTLTEIAEALTQELSRELGRVVIDKTGIQGRYDIVLKWTPEASTDAARNGNDNSTSQSYAGPSIFTALKEQGWAEARIRKRPSQGPCHRSCRDARGKLTRRPGRIGDHPSSTLFAACWAIWNCPKSGYVWNADGTLGTTIR